jgi:hypothetical protein
MIFPKLYPKPEIWVLLVFVFFINYITPLDEMLSTFIGDGTPELIKRVTQLGVVIGIVILESINGSNWLIL